MTVKDEILEYTKKIYENSSEIKILQEKLDDMLSAIDKINLDYNKGKIPKEIFETDNKKLREQCVDLIKGINKCIDDSLNYLKIIKNELPKIGKEKIKIKRKAEKIGNIQAIETGDSIYQVSPTALKK